MANGVIVPNIKEEIVALATNAKLSIRSEKILDLSGLELDSNGAVSSLIPSAYLPKQLVFNACIFIKGTSYKMGYVIVRTNGNIEGVIVENGTYATADTYTIYGQATWL